MNRLFSLKLGFWFNGSETLKRILILMNLVSPAIAVGDDMHIGLETFHSNMRSTATFAEVYFDKRMLTYNNAPGVGLIGLHSVADDWALGLGLGYVRYYQGNARFMDRTSMQLFARYFWWRRDVFELFSKTGFSQQQLHADQPKSSGFHSNYEPIFNYDVGIGGALKLGSGSFALEYRYADSISKGRASVSYPYLILSSPAGSPVSAKLKLKDIEIQTHELALTTSVAL